MHYPKVIVKDCTCKECKKEKKELKKEGKSWIFAVQTTGKIITWSTLPPETDEWKSSHRKTKERKRK